MATPRPHLDARDRAARPSGWIAAARRSAAAWPAAAWASFRRRSQGAARWAMILLGPALGVAMAYLVVTGWQIAVVFLGILLMIPMVVVLHRYPFLSLFIWLMVDQFLLTTEFVLPYRVAFWMIHRALPPATLGIMVLSSLLRVSRRRLPRLGLAELAMAGYLVVSLLSITLLNATPLPTAYRLYDRVFIPICLYLIVRLSAPDEKDLQRLVVVALFVCAAQSAIGLVSWVAPGALPRGWLGQLGERTIGSLINTSTYTATLMFCGLLLFQSALNRKPGMVRTLYLSTFMLAVLLTFLSFSRASWLGMMLGILGLFFLYPAFMARLGFIVMPIVIVVLSAGLLSNQLGWANERLYSEEAEGSALDRLPAYFAAVRMLAAKPLFGWGYENFELYDRPFQGRVLDFRNDNKDHANHSAYLTILAEQGIIGFCLYLAPLLWWLTHTIRTLPRMPAEGFWSKKLLIMLWLSVLNIFILNNFTPAWVVYGLGLWWITLGLIGNMVQRQRAALRYTHADW